MFVPPTSNLGPLSPAVTPGYVLAQPQQPWNNTDKQTGTVTYKNLGSVFHTSYEFLETYVIDQVERNLLIELGQDGKLDFSVPPFCHHSIVIYLNIYHLCFLVLSSHVYLTFDLIYLKMKYIYIYINLFCFVARELDEVTNSIAQLVAEGAVITLITLKNPPCCFVAICFTTYLIHVPVCFSRYVL